MEVIFKSFTDIPKPQFPSITIPAIIHSLTHIYQLTRNVPRNEDKKINKQGICIQ